MITVIRIIQLTIWKNISNLEINVPSVLGKEVEHVNTVCLPFDYVDEKSWAGKNLVVAGWGYVKQDAMRIEGI